MEALLAKKTMVVHRTSLTTPLYNASVALHHAINGMKPRLMKKKMMVELLKGVGEVNLLKDGDAEERTAEDVQCQPEVRRDEQGGEDLHQEERACPGVAGAEEGQDRAVLLLSTFRSTTLHTQNTA